jgi:predicted nucleic-acid-binding protein
VLVRALVRDDSGQSETARALLSRPFTVTATVLAETEWVLRSRYGLARATIAAALRDLIDLPDLMGVPAGLGWAIERFEAGADFADMLHLITAETADSFVTFDRRVVRKAGAATPIPIETIR